MVEIGSSASGMARVLAWCSGWPARLRHSIVLPRILPWYVRGVERCGWGVCRRGNKGPNDYSAIGVWTCTCFPYGIMVATVVAEEHGNRRIENRARNIIVAFPHVTRRTLKDAETPEAS